MSPLGAFLAGVGTGVVAVIGFAWLLSAIDFKARRR